MLAAAVGCATYESALLSQDGYGSGDGGSNASQAGEAGQAATRAGQGGGGKGGASSVSAGTSNGGRAFGGTAGTSSGGSEAGTGSAGEAGMRGDVGDGGAGGSPGSGGSAGGPNACGQHVITSKVLWDLSSEPSSVDSPLPNAYDGSSSTRWTTGQDQAGDEWLELDFGAKVALSQVTLRLGDSSDDYPRLYELRFSDVSLNVAAPVLLAGSGAPGVDTVMSLEAPVTGRYLHIAQTGTAPGRWWSVAEIEVKCVQ